MKKKDHIIKNTHLPIFMVSLFLGIASLVGYIFQKLNFSETNIVIVYILFVLLSARLTTGYVYGILSAIASTFAYNYFFTKPYYTFQVDNPGYIITFVIMTITATITSALTSRVKHNADQIKEKEIETRALYHLTKDLTVAKDIQDIANITKNAICQIIPCKVESICFYEEGTVAEEEKISYWPIYGQEHKLGIIGIPKTILEQLGESQVKLLATMIESSALAMDRFQEFQQRLKTKEEMEKERYRGNLLRAISHDLRTPLSGIMGTAEMLMDMLEQEDKKELVYGIYNDADWLRTLVENILNLTRLQEGKLMVNKEYEALEEMIGSAINHLSRRANKFDIEVEMPDQVILIPMDARLIMQVLINLLDNAMKHSVDQNAIMIKVLIEEEKRQVKVSVIDHGEGIDPIDLPNIFQMFYTSHCRRADVKQGTGLGLSICEAIIKAHGGTIEGKNREGTHGAVISFTLPMEEIKNE